MASLTRGDFKQRITFRVVSKSQDDSGGHEETYSDLLTTFAFVKSKSGNRVFEDGYDRAVDRKIIYVYYRKALDVVNKDTRIVYLGKEYAIDNQSFVNEVKEVLKFEVTGS